MSHGLRGLRRGCADDRLLRFGFESHRGHFGSVVCCRGRSLCYEPITRPEDSYGLWCVVFCDL